MSQFRRFFLCHSIILLFVAGIPCAFAQHSVLTYHNDNMRTGQNLLESTLTLQNVQSSTFGKLFTLSVDGKVDAQPLVAANVNIPGVGLRNVAFVATEHDSLYAFDADTGTKYWQVSLLKSGETSSDSRNCGQVSPEIGVTATPVIDSAAGAHGTIYVVAMSKDGSGGYHQRLHAIDITTGGEQFNGPVDIQATYTGTGDNASGGNVVFDPKQYKARPGLLLVKGVVYTSWSSHCDIRPYTGWTMGYNQTTLAQTSVFNFTPNGNEGAIWGAGAGASADSAGNLFFQLGNGTFDPTLDVSGFPNKADFGNAFVKLSLVNGALKAMDYWTMFNTVSESNADEDLGSGGVLLLPDVTDGNQTVRHLGAGAGKDRNLYLFDRDNMGKFNPSTNGNIYQVLPTALGGSEFASPAWFNGLLYFGSVGDVIRGYQMTNGLLGTSPATSTLNSFGFPGTTPSISANGTSNAILWAVENSSPAKLHAYNAVDLLTELYNSGQASGGRDQFGSGNKFMTPTIVNGKVYVGTPNSVAVFGLLSIGATPTLTSVNPSSGMAGTAAGVTLTGTNFISGASVGVSGSGVTVSNVAVVSATQITATFTIAANAATVGRSVSVTTTAGTSNTQTFTVNPGTAAPTIAKAFGTTSITSGGSSLVTLTLANGNASALTGGAFTDTLTNMSAVGGAVGGTCTGTTPSSLAAGAPALSFTGINIPASGSCTVTFSVTSSHVGGNPNTTSGVTTTQTPVAGSPSDTATLTVTAGLVAPTIAKAFSPASIAVGGSSAVTLTLANGNASALTGGAFTDTLTNMSAVGGAVGGTCTGTTPSSLTAGATALSFTGINIPASGGCTVTFSVTSSLVGGNPNTTSGVTTTQIPTAGSASNTATLTVTTALVPPTIAKAFSPSSIVVGGSSSVTLTLANGNASALTGGAFTDTLTNMSAVGGAVGGTCTGTTPSSLTAGATALSFTGINIPASGSCTVTFSVTSSHAGGNPNTTSGVTTTQTPVAGSVSNTATLTVTSAGGGGLNENFESGASGWTATGLWHLASSSSCAAPSAGYSSATHAYYYGQDASCNYNTGSANSGSLTSPPVAGINGQSTLRFSYFLQTEGAVGFDTATVFVVANGGAPTQLTTLSVNDTSWHTVSPISLSQFAGQTIQIRFTFNTVDAAFNGFKGWFLDDVLVTAAGGQTSSPTIAKAFSPASIAVGGSSTVTLTLSNGNGSALTGGAFTDTLTNMSAAGGAVGGTCVGTTPSSLTAGATALSFMGITIPASSSCTVTFSVTSSHVGGNPNSTSGVTTTQTAAGAASNTATLTVTAGLVSPTIAKAFSPASIAVGGSSTVTLTLSNGNGSALTGGAFTDTLTNMSAAGGAVGGTCTGTIPSSLTAGATALSFMGITIPASGSCTVTFSVTSSHVGGNPNSTSGVTTTQTAAGAASNTATLTVTAGLVSPTIAKAFSPASIAVGGSSLVTLTLSNGNGSALTGAAFTDTLTNMTAAGGAVGGTCTGTIPSSLTAGATALSFTGITIPASSSCTVTFSVTSTHVGGNPNTTSGVTTTQAATGAASNSATLTVTGGGGGGINESFESGAAGWTATGLWHLASNSSCVTPALGYSSATHAYYYGQDAGCNYNTQGGPNTGSLTSPVITGITAQSTLQFGYYLGTEGTAGFDTAKVSVVGPGGVVTQLTAITTNDAMWHTTAPLSLGQFAGQAIQIRFTFNTVDAAFNSFKGWLVDDVVVVP